VREDHRLPEGDCLLAQDAQEVREAVGWPLGASGVRGSRSGARVGSLASKPGFAWITSRAASARER
jgi:hypothetical protein